MARELRSVFDPANDHSCDVSPVSFSVWRSSGADSRIVFYCFMAGTHTEFSEEDRVGPIVAEACCALGSGSAPVLIFYIPGLGLENKTI